MCESRRTTGERLFAQDDWDRVDGDGFLDAARTPRLVTADRLLAGPCAWVVGAPWLGKSFVAQELSAQIRAERGAPGVAGRVALADAGLPSLVDFPPPWWHDWATGPAESAAWVIDGFDELVDRTAAPARALLDALESVPDDHLRRLRLVLFSRPYAELGELQECLRSVYSRRLGVFPERFWLARLGRDAAEVLVGSRSFPRVLDVIRSSRLQTVAGYPAVLKFLARQTSAARLDAAGVWRGVLLSLLGEPASNPLARPGGRLRSTADERFASACRVASALTLTGVDEVYEFSSDPEAVSVGGLWEPPSPALQAAAAEVLRTPAFAPLPGGGFRFSRANVQDWFTAFAFCELPASALRSALGGGSPRLLESARLLRSLGVGAEFAAELDRLGVAGLGASDAGPLPPAALAAALDRLEELDAQAPWGLRLGEARGELERFRAEGVGRELARRLADPTRGANAKRLLLYVSEVIRAHEALGPALTLLRDPLEDERVRECAAGFAAEAASDAELADSIAVLTARDSAASETDRRLLGELLAEVQSRNVWPQSRLVLALPPCEENRLDGRQQVLARAQNALTLEDARNLLPSLRTLVDRHADTALPHELPEIVARVLDLIAVHPRPADVEELVRFAEGLMDDGPGWSRASEVARRLQREPLARRAFYERDLQVGDERRLRLHTWNMLDPSDWEWVLEVAARRFPESREAWGWAHWVATRAHEAGLLDAAGLAAVEARVERHAPGFAAAQQAGREQYAREVAEEQEQARLRRERNPRRRPLETRVAAVLDGGAPADVQMRSLAYLCFAPDYGLPPQATGTWSGLPDGVRGRVVDACRYGLQVAEPTPLPGENAYPRDLIAEGAAFECAVLEGGRWGTPELIRRWLPATLCCKNSGDLAALLRECLAIDPAATHATLIEVADLLCRVLQRPHALRGIPPECWTDGLMDLTSKLTTEPSVGPAGRRWLLEHLAELDPDSALLVAREWAAFPWDAGEQVLRAGGLGLLLRLRPAEAAAILEPDVESRGAASLECGLRWTRENARRGGARWDVPTRERAARLLVRAYPPSADPGFQAGIVTEAQELRWARDELLYGLLDGGSQDENDAIDRLARLDTTLRDLVATTRASGRAAAELPQLGGRTDVTAPLIAQAVRLLGRADYRLIRSDDDLLDAVLEALSRIDGDAGRDLPMLYSAPDGGERRHLHEDALQAYLRLRIEGELQRLADGVEVLIVREDQVSRRQRLDLRITAPCLRGRRLATVVVEVKWSTNAEAATGLAEQLGRRYLIGEQLTHGVFAVGWSGFWRPGKGRRKLRDLGGFRSELLTRRDAFCAHGADGAELRIEPFVLDLRWRTGDGG